MNEPYVVDNKKYILVELDYKDKSRGCNVCAASNDMGLCECLPDDCLEPFTNLIWKEVE